MTETVPRWIIYLCVHIHSQGKLNESKGRRMMSLCMVILSLAWDREINISLFFCDVFVWKWGPRPRTRSRCYHGNKSAATFKKDIFVYPPWVPNCIQNLKGGWKFSFPKLFDSYRDLFLNGKRYTNPRQCLGFVKLSPKSPKL